GRPSASRVARPRRRSPGAPVRSARPRSGGPHGGASAARRTSPSSRPPPRIPTPGAGPRRRGPHDGRGSQSYGDHVARVSPVHTDPSRHPDPRRRDRRRPPLAPTARGAEGGVAEADPEQEDERRHIPVLVRAPDLRQPQEVDAARHAGDVREPMEAPPPPRAEPL